MQNIQRQESQEDRLLLFVSPRCLKETMQRQMKAFETLFCEIRGCTKTSLTRDRAHNKCTVADLGQVTYRFCKSRPCFSVHEALQQFRHSQEEMIFAAKDVSHIFRHVCFCRMDFQLFAGWVSTFWGRERQEQEHRNDSIPETPHVGNSNGRFFFPSPVRQILHPTIKPFESNSAKANTLKNAPDILLCRHLFLTES